MKEEETRERRRMSKQGNFIIDKMIIKIVDIIG